MLPILEATWTKQLDTLLKAQRLHSLSVQNAPSRIDQPIMAVEDRINPRAFERVLPIGALMFEVSKDQITIGNGYGLAFAISQNRIVPDGSTGIVRPYQSALTGLTASFVNGCEVTSMCTSASCPPASRMW